MALTDLERTVVAREIANELAEDGKAAGIVVSDVLILASCRARGIHDARKQKEMVGEVQQILLGRLLEKRSHPPDRRGYGHFLENLEEKHDSIHGPGGRLL